MKTHCKNGHPRIPENLAASGECKICRKVRASSHSRKAYNQAYNARPERIAKSQARNASPEEKAKAKDRYKAQHPHVPKTHCKRGHPRIPENLSKNGGCKICTSERGHQRYVAQQAILGRPVLTREEYKEVQRARRKTQCINGHPYTPDTRRKNRGCIVCNREQERARRAKKAMPKVPKTHCLQGHPRTPENTLNNGSCRVCRRLAEKRRDQARSALSKARKAELAKVWINSSTGNPVSTSRKLDLRAHGWTQQMYETTLFEQGNVCASCRLPFTKENPPCADHRHSKPPEPRGVLHAKCNSLIGFAKEDPAVCRAAAEYLEAWTV